MIQASRLLALLLCFRILLLGTLVLACMYGLVSQGS